MNGSSRTNKDHNQQPQLTRNTRRHEQQRRPQRRQRRRLTQRNSSKEQNKCRFARAQAIHTPVHTHHFSLAMRRRTPSMEAQNEEKKIYHNRYERIIE